MTLLDLTFEEKNRLLKKIESGDEKLPIYEVPVQAVRFCESRGIKPVIYYAFLNIEYDANDTRCVNNSVDVRHCIDNPKEGDFLKIRKVLLELRLQQKIIIPSALAQYVAYINRLKNKEKTLLFSEL